MSKSDDIQADINMLQQFIRDRRNEIKKAEFDIWELEQELSQEKQRELKDMRENGL